MNINRRKLISLLASLVCLMNGLSTSAMAEKREMQWTTVQQTLDCDGGTVEINAVSDPNIPETVCEWRTEGKVWTEEELRHIVSIVSPGDENMQRQSIGIDDGVGLFDDLKDTSASAGVGYLKIEYHVKEEGLEYAANPMWNTGYCSDEPLKTPVADLTFLSFQSALDQITPVLSELDCTIGPPANMLAWDVKALQANWDRWHALYPEIGARTWTAQEECYQIQFPVYYQGLRLNMQGGITNRDDLDNVGCYIAFLINANRLISLNANDFCMVNGKAITQPQKMLTLTEAIECYRQMEASTFFTQGQEKTIIKILPEYLVLKDIPSNKATYRLIPAWCFYYQIPLDGGTDAMELHYDAIHAITGQAIEY